MRYAVAYCIMQSFNDAVKRSIAREAESGTVRLRTGSPVALGSGRWVPPSAASARAHLDRRSRPRCSSPASRPSCPYRRATAAGGWRRGACGYAA